MGKVSGLLEDQLPWWIAGPALGLCVVAIRALLNRRLGVVGGFSEVVERIEARTLAFGWRAFFLFGLIAGALAYTLARGGPPYHGYGWLTTTFTGGAEWVAAPILVFAGLLIGFGTKTASGCTSGNGLSGSAMLSPASLLSTATFFGTAIVLSFLIEAVI
jgi:uncharacterized membrane protein YedE/YeeE